MQTPEQIAADHAAAAVPWYRQPYVWLVIGLPLASVLASFTVLYLAIVHRDDLVRDDWSKAARAINQDLQADHRARDLGLGGTLVLDPAALTLTLQLVGDSAALPPRLTLLLAHATLSREDMTVLFTRSADGNYSGSVPRLPMGKRHLSLEPAGAVAQDARWRLRAADVIFQGEPVSLQPGQ